MRAFSTAILLAAAASFASSPDSLAFWSEVPERSRYERRAGPVPHAWVRLGHPRQWTLRLDRVRSVRPGQTWHFRAVVAGRRLGWLGGGGGPRLLVRDSSGREYPTPLESRWDAGSFGWKEIRLRASIPPGAATLEAEFYGFGGGEYLVRSVGLDTAVAGPVDLMAPLPESEVLEAGLPIEPGASRSLYLPGDTLVWRIAAGAREALDLGYRVLDGQGRILDTGKTALGGTVRFRPPGDGYYELAVADLPGGLVQGRLGAMVAPLPRSWAPGANPFGFPDATPEELRRLGFTWTRPLHGNIVEGGAKRLPEDLLGYRAAWTRRVKAGLPPTHLNTVEIWNEPHNELAPGTWDMAAFVAMVSASRRGIRAASPRTRIAVNWEFLDGFQAFHAAGGKGLYEVACIHPYSRRIFLDGPAAVSDSPEADGLSAQLDSARAVLAGKEIWSTEFGWPTAPGHPWSVSEQDQARYIVRSALLQLAHGVRRVMPFKSEDVPGWGPRHGSLGLRRADLTPKPSLAAYAALARNVDALPYVGRLDLGDARVAALVFGSEGRTVVAVWSPQEIGEITLRLPAGARAARGIFGETWELPTAAWILRPGPSPAYLSAAAGPAQLAKAAGRPLLKGPPRGLFGATPSAGRATPTPRSSGGRRTPPAPDPVPPSPAAP